MFEKIAKEYKEDKLTLQPGMVFMGDYHLESYDKFGNLYEVTDEHNLITSEALIQFAKLIGEQATLGSWYVGVGSGTYSPVATTTGSTFASEVGEFQGYSQTTRPQFSKGTVTTIAEITNQGEHATFSITEDVTIKTVGILTSNVKGGTGGYCLSVLGTNKTFSAGDTFKVQWKLTLLSQ